MEETLPPQTEEAAGFEPPRLRQLTVFLENRVGRLQTLLRALEEEAGPVAALAIEESADAALLRLVCLNTDAAANALRQSGFASSESDVLAIELPAKNPHPLLTITTALVAAEINIHYCYPMLGGPNKAVLVLNTDDLTLAARLLLRKGFTLIAQSDLKKWK